MDLGTSTTDTSLPNAAELAVENGNPMAAAPGYKNGSNNVPKKVHIKTFGCQMNVYDSNRMLGLLGEKGYVPEPELQKADVILINTCSIRDKSEHKVLSLLGELKPLKEKKPSIVLGIAGCVGQRMGRKLLQRVPHLDLVFGPDSVDRVAVLVEDVVNRGARIVEAEFEKMSRAYTQPAVIPSAKPSEYLTIMKGCDHFCTYCIVPYVRGREKSRPIAEIIDDVKKFVSMGTREITFLGQNINTFGKGTPEKLSQLIEAAHEVEGLERIRYVTSHPRDLGMDLIEQFGQLPKLMPLLHLPFQSGSDAVLKRMSRLYTAKDYLGKVEALKKACPDIALSTDVIVGFPGETEADFEQTLKIMHEVEFSTAFMFKYSPRPGTRAIAFEADAIPEKVKEERLLRLQQLANPTIERENARYLGRTVPVLIESIDKKGRFFSGRNPHGKIVHVMNAGAACIGKIIDVEITDTNGSNLKGYYVDAERKNRQPDDAVSAQIQIS
jgi:tRNA-2-methylthio-N6-dimethylallyladenosine synthase